LKVSQTPWSRPG